MEDRDERIRELSAEGITQGEIARREGISRQRVSQILNKDRSRDEHRVLLSANIRELEKIKKNPKAVHSAIGKTVVDPETGELVRDQSIQIAAAREQRLQAESIRRMDALDREDSTDTELEELLAWLRDAPQEMQDAMREVKALRADIQIMERDYAYVCQDREKLRAELDTVRAELDRWERGQQVWAELAL